jgi:hypothetical protein
MEGEVVVFLVVVQVGATPGTLASKRGAARGLRRGGRQPIRALAAR